MSKLGYEKRTDLEKCRDKIKALLLEYNCELLDQDEGSWVLLHDKDTGITDNVYSS